MKKLNRTVMALCAMTLVFGTVSCKKDKTTEPGGRMTIGASIDLPAGTGDKTEVDPSTGLVKWTSDDKIMLYSGTNGKEFSWESMVSDDETKARFVGDNPGEVPYYGAYKATDYLGSGAFAFNIPADQSVYNSGKFENGPMLAYTTNEKSIKFHNAASWMRIGLKGLAQISKVELIDNTTGAVVNGTMTASIDVNGNVTASMNAGGNNTLFVTFDQPLQLMYGSLTYVNFLVPEGSFQNGATVNVYDFKNNKLETISGPAFDVQMNKIYNIATSTIIKPVAPEGSTGAIFNVGTESNPRMVYIAKGNLVCDRNSMTWSFKNDQLDVCGEEALFTWSNSVYNDYGTNLHPVPPLYFLNSEYSFVDWGNNAITNGGNEANKWFTGSVEEWENVQTNHGRAICFIDMDGSGDIDYDVDAYGMVLLPLAFPKELDIETGAILTLEQWYAMAEAGAVFLRNTCQSSYYQEEEIWLVTYGMGCYYTSSKTEGDFGFPWSYGFPDPRYGGRSFDANNYWASFGFNVRLFQDVVK